MAELKLAFNYVNGFPFIKIEGDLTVNSFAALHLVAKGATKFGTVPVIVDLSGELHISNEVNEIKCWRYPSKIPDFARRVVLFVISPPGRLGEVEALLTPHRLKQVANVQEALDIISSAPGEVS